MQMPGEGLTAFSSWTPPTAWDLPMDDAESMTAKQAQQTLGQLQEEINRLQRSIRLAIQGQLLKLASQSLGTLELNQQLAKSIHALLESHGLRVRCNECGHPAILRVSPRAGVANGVFVFDHTIDGRRTFHGGRSTMPEVRLVSKPARRNSKEDRAAG